MIASFQWLSGSTGSARHDARMPVERGDYQPVGLVFALAGAGAFVVVAGLWALQVLYRLPAERAVTASVIVLGGVCVAAPLFWAVAIWLFGRLGATSTDQVANRGAVGFLVVAFALGPVVLLGPGWGTAMLVAGAVALSALWALVRAAARVAPLVPVRSRVHHSDDDRHWIARVR